MTHSTQSNQSTVKKVINGGTVRTILLGSGLVLVAGVAWYGYRWHSIGKEETAQKVLVDCLAQFDKAEQDKNADWASLQAIASVAYSQQKNTNAAPYLLALEAEALIHLDKKAEAIERMDKAINALSSSSPFYAIYKIKRALMKLDGDQQLVQLGITELQELAQDTKNKNNDEAQFYLGLYYLSRNDLEQAKQAWQPLLDFPQEGDGSSPWAMRAQEKMKLL